MKLPGGARGRAKPLSPGLRLALLAGTAVLALAAAGCGAAGAGDTSATPPTVLPTPSPEVTTNTATPTAPPSGAATTTTGVPPMADAVIRLEKTGGFAGVRQVVTIDPSGVWRYSDARTGKTQQGTLTADQRSQLGRLIAEPSFASQVRQKPASSTCNDTFVYSVSIGELRATMDDCVTKDRPAVRAVIDYIVRSTPL